jgi:hypothetical protein
LASAFRLGPHSLFDPTPQEIFRLEIVLRRIRYDIRDNEAVLPPIEASFNGPP